MGNKMYKQIIIVRKDLGMTPGKLAAQVSHASMAFLTNDIRRSAGKWITSGNHVYYSCELDFEQDIYEQWINGIFTKVVLEAKNKNQLLKAKAMAEELGMIENIDFFLINDCCNTELTPEFFDENGVGRTLTCIGFKPMNSEVVDKIGKKYQLLK